MIPAFVPFAIFAKVASIIVSGDTRITPTGDTRIDPAGDTRVVAAGVADITGIVNVKDVVGPDGFPAMGNGSHDDTAVLQLAINKAFPGGSSTANKILYIPAGNYNIFSPLYISNVNGGVIVGDGGGSTTITYSGDPNAGNTVTGDGLTPIFVCNNVSNTKFDGIVLSCNLGAVGMYNSLKTCCAYFFCSGGGNCDGNFFQNCALLNAGTSVMLGGAGVDQICRGNIFLACSIGRSALYGFRVSSAASYGHMAFGGSIAFCGGSQFDESPNSTYVPGVSVGNMGAAFSMQNGGFAVVTNQSWDGNKRASVINATPLPFCSLGCRDEGGNYFYTSLVSSPGPIFATAHIYGGALAEVHPGESGGTLGRQPCAFADASIGNGIVHAYGSEYAPVAPVAGNIGTIAAVGTTGKLIWDTSTYGVNYFDPVTLAICVGFAGGPGSMVVLRSALAQTTAAGAQPQVNWYLPINYTGSFAGAKLRQGTFNATVGGVGPAVPVASAMYAGTRAIITDSPTAMAGNFNAIISAGGGSNKVPIYCDGVNWRIGG